MKWGARSAIAILLAAVSAAVPACFSFGDLSGGTGPGASDGSTGSDGTAPGDGSTTGNDGATGVKVVELAVGGTDACAVLSNGEIWCWGGDELGGLGVDPAKAPSSCATLNGTVGCNPTPTKVAGIDDVVHASAGAGQVCAVKRDGTIFCWGDNDHGQLGHASGTGGDITCNTLPCNPVPSQVADLPKMASVSAGGTFTCGVSTTGAPYCWGSNNYGQLGDGDTTNGIDRPTPILLSGIGGTVAEIATSAVAFTACARRTDGQVWCWGENTSGETGHPPNTLNDLISPPHAFTHVPQPVGEDVDGGVGGIITDATAISVAFGVGCELDGTGAPHCWGYSKWGMLGDVGSAGYAFPKPGTILGLTTTFKSITGRWTDMCGLDAAGQVWCWGLNNFGQIGGGDTTGNSGTLTCDLTCRTYPFALSGLTATQLSSNGTTLALRPNGTSIVGWGANYEGALGHAPGQNGDLACPFGDASTACAPTPVDVYDFH